MSNLLKTFTPIASVLLLIPPTAQVLQITVNYRMKTMLHSFNNV